MLKNNYSPIKQSKINIDEYYLMLVDLYMTKIKQTSNFNDIHLIWIFVFNDTFSNISAIYFRRPVLAVEKTGVPGENHRPWASNW